MHLSEAPHRRMRMSELAAACNLSLSGMTRVVNRLEKQGLVRRAKCEEDLRGWNAVLTDDGLARLREAWPSHLDSIRRHVLDNLAGHDLAALAAALRRVATAPDPTNSPTRRSGDHQGVRHRFGAPSTPLSVAVPRRSFPGIGSGCPTGPRGLR